MIKVGIFMFDDSQTISLADVAGRRHFFRIVGMTAGTEVDKVHLHCRLNTGHDLEVEDDTLTANTQVKGK